MTFDHPQVGELRLNRAIDGDHDREIERIDEMKGRRGKAGAGETREDVIREVQDSHVQQLQLLDGFHAGQGGLQ